MIHHLQKSFFKKKKKNSLDFASVCLVLQPWFVRHRLLYDLLMPLDHVPTWFAMQSHFIEIFASAIRKPYSRRRIVSLDKTVVLNETVFSVIILSVIVKPPPPSTI